MDRVPLQTVPATVQLVDSPTNKFLKKYWQTKSDNEQERDGRYLQRSRNVGLKPAARFVLKCFQAAGLAELYPLFSVALPGLQLIRIEFVPERLQHRSRRRNVPNGKPEKRQLLKPALCLGEHDLKFRFLSREVEDVVIAHVVYGRNDNAHDDELDAHEEDEPRDRPIRGATAQWSIVTVPKPANVRRHPLVRRKSSFSVYDFVI